MHYRLMLGFPTTYTPDNGETTNPTSLTICLEHAGLRDSGGNELKREDCFVRGFGAADILFIVDSSSSMAGPIEAVKTAAPAVAEQLAGTGVDVNFALVDHENLSTLELDLTGDTTVFQDAVTAGLVAAGTRVNGWDVLEQAIVNEFDNDATPTE